MLQLGCFFYTTSVLWGSHRHGPSHYERGRWEGGRLGWLVADYRVCTSKQGWQTHSSLKVLGNLLDDTDITTS